MGFAFLSLEKLRSTEPDALAREMLAYDRSDPAARASKEPGYGIDSFAGLLGRAYELGRSDYVRVGRTFRSYYDGLSGIGGRGAPPMGEDYRLFSALARFEFDTVDRPAADGLREGYGHTAVADAFCSTLAVVEMHMLKDRLRLDSPEISACPSCRDVLVRGRDGLSDGAPGSILPPMEWTEDLRRRAEIMKRVMPVVESPYYKDLGNRFLPSGSAETVWSSDRINMLAAAALVPAGAARTRTDMSERYGDLACFLEEGVHGGFPEETYEAAKRLFRVYDEFWRGEHDPAAEPYLKIRMQDGGRQRTWAFYSQDAVDMYLSEVLDASSDVRGSHLACVTSDSDAKAWFDERVAHYTAESDDSLYEPFPRSVPGMPGLLPREAWVKSMEWSFADFRSLNSFDPEYKRMQAVRDGAMKELASIGGREAVNVVEVFDEVGFGSVDGARAYLMECGGPHSDCSEMMVHISPDVPAADAYGIVTALGERKGLEARPFDEWKAGKPAFMSDFRAPYVFAPDVAGVENRGIVDVPCSSDEPERNDGLTAGPF